jgi:hypothetical protein
VRPRWHNVKDKIMIAGGRSKTVVFVAILALTTFGAVATASAQPADIIAIDKAFQDHYARGNYPAAEIDAQELERLAKARFGADHPYYAVALNKLGIVSDRLSKLGIKGLVAHGLRTTFAVHCTELGVPTEYLQRLLGHKRIQQSAEYAESVNAELMNLKAFEIMRKKAA